MKTKKSHEWRNCSEADLKLNIEQWKSELGDALFKSVLFLEGEMGAGKSTFARVFLEQLCPEQLTRGSPTFPIIQQYKTSEGLPVYHIDLYRLKNEQELDDIGMDSVLEASPSLIMIEWGSLFPDYFEFLGAPQLNKTCYRVQIQARAEDTNGLSRDYFIKTLDRVQLK